MYIFLVGHPGIGKTRTVGAAGQFLRELPEFYTSPTSMSAASLVDALAASKRTIVSMNSAPLEYNTMTILADELGAFMHKYDDEMIGDLTTFYDVNVPYSQHRRGKEIRIKIAKPQLSILCGTTPSNLIKFMPDNAWDQGFTSRVIMIYSDERIITDVFSNPRRSLPDPMLYDLRVINGLTGQFLPNEDYRSLINAWREQGQCPVPSHPKLTHYCTRRLTHLFKLSMVSSVDRDNSLVLNRDDFNRAMNWLVHAEEDMPEIFRAGSVTADSKVMEEIYHFVASAKREVPEYLLVRMARERLPLGVVPKVIETMEKSGMIRAVGFDKRTGTRNWIALED